MAAVEDQFLADKEALAAACERVAAALGSESPSQHLWHIAATLRYATDWEAQAQSAASIRGFFHRDGMSDRPPPAHAMTWDGDMALLWDLSTIYVETRYRDVQSSLGRR